MRISDPGPLLLESDALPTELPGAPFNDGGGGGGGGGGEKKLTSKCILTIISDTRSAVLYYSCLLQVFKRTVACIDLVNLERK